MKEKVIVYRSEKQVEVDFFGFLWGFSSAFEEFNQGIGQSPVAIIEDAHTGAFHLIYPVCVRREQRTDEQLHRDGDFAYWEGPHASSSCYGNLCEDGACGGCTKDSCDGNT